MNNGIFVVGTDTDIGKTFITGGILYLLRKNNINATYFKAALSGAVEKDNKLIPGDTEFVCNLSGLKEDYSVLTPYVYKTAVSPHLAAQIENKPIDLNVVAMAYKKIKEKYDFVVAEGSGGIICPIVDGDRIILLEDIIKLTGLDTVLIADAGLGSINHTVLTFKYMESKDIKIKGIIINNYDKKDICHRDNVNMIEKLTGKSIIAKFPTIKNENDENSIREAFDKLDYKKIVKYIR